MGVLDAMTLSKELVGLSDGGDLPRLHGLLEVLQSLGRDQLLATTLVHPALQKLLHAALLIGGEPPLALTPGVTQSPGGFSQVGTLLALKEPEHPDALEEVRVAMVLLQFLEIIDIFGDYLRVEYLCHAFIMPSTKRIGITTNTLFYGDNLAIMREYIPDESIDLVYLDPPFNSNRNYNVLFKDESGRCCGAK